MANNDQEDDMSTFGEIVKEKRKEMGLSQWELAEKVGVAQNTVSGWERGDHYPDILMAAELADVFGCSIDELVGRTV